MVGFHRRRPHEKLHVLLLTEMTIEEPANNQNPVRLRWGISPPLVIIEWGVALAFAAAFAIHVSYYWWQNGTCAGWGTGIVAFIPTRGAGSLPYVLGNEAQQFPAINPTALQLSWFDVAWYLVVLGSAGLLIVSLLLSRKQRWRRRVSAAAPWGLVLFAAIGCSNLEQFTSCDLYHTHVNLQMLFDRGGDKAARLTPPGGSGDVQITEIPIAATYRLFELNDPESGEPTGGAYVVKLPLKLPVSVAKRFPEWLSLPQWRELPDAIELQPALDAIDRHIDQGHGTQFARIMLFTVLPFAKEDGEYASIVGVYPG